MWNYLIVSHEGPFETRDTKITTLRLKSNGFKALEGEKVQQTFTRNLLIDLENKDVKIPQARVNATFVNNNDSDVEEDTRSSQEFLVDLKQEYLDRTLLTNHRRLYKISRRVGVSRTLMDNSKESSFGCGK
ncbi:hypothetical protein Tco_1040398 [Tanacetum coccineum]